MVRVISVADLGIDIPHTDVADGISYGVPFIPSPRKEQPQPTRRPLKKVTPAPRVPTKPITVGKELL